MREKADALHPAEGISPECDTASVQDTSSRRFQLWPAIAGGLRAEHVFKGVARELGESQLSPRELNPVRGAG